MPSLRFRFYSMIFIYLFTDLCSMMYHIHLENEMNMCLHENIEPHNINGYVKIIETLNVLCRGRWKRITANHYYRSLFFLHVYPH